MIYSLKNCRNGEDAPYKTTVDITEKEGILTFTFVAEHCQYYCPHSRYNDIHSEGDACEILIGSDPDRKVYYEIEISPENVLMIAQMTYMGVDENNEPMLKIDFVEKPFVTSEVTKTENGYVAKLSFAKKDILSGEGEIYFNAYRLDTDGEEMNKHLFALNPTMRDRFHVPSYYVYLKDFVKEE